MSVIASNDIAGKSYGNETTFRNDLKVLLLTSSLLVDRVFLHTDMLAALKDKSDVCVWATSATNNGYASLWNQTGVRVERFPEVRPFKEIPHNYLRRFNEFVWDYSFQPPSRLSMLRHVREKSMPASVKALKAPAWLMARLGSEKIVENLLEPLLLAYPRSEEAVERLKKERPTVLLTTGPFQFEQPAIFAAAKKLGIPVLAYIPSWDNISTKNRMVYKYDGYIVWSEQTKNELHDFYPVSKNVPVYVCGAPQFDVFFQEKFYQSREEFFSKQGLNPDLPVILYAVGSPNFLKEHHGAIHLAERVARGDLGDVQMLVRAHPIHDNAEMKELFEKYGQRIKLQLSPNAGKNLVARSQDEQQIIEWVNTFRYADVVVNLSSTVAIDAAIFDVPVVNLDFDPQPGQADQNLIKDVNHLWTHFKPIAESDGLWLVNDFDEMVHAVKAYLENPALHREKRKWVADYVCGFLDGKCGERMAEAILDFADSRT